MLPKPKQQDSKATVKAIKVQQIEETGLFRDGEPRQRITSLNISPEKERGQKWQRGKKSWGRCPS